MFEVIRDGRYYSVVFWDYESIEYLDAYETEEQAEARAARLNASIGQ